MKDEVENKDKLCRVLFKTTTPLAKRFCFEHILCGKS